jgi:hypothetical protein
VRLGLLHKREPFRDNSRSKVTIGFSLHPDLEDARDGVGNAIDKEGWIGKGKFIDLMEGPREGLLHTGFDEGARKDEPNDRSRPRRMSNELLGQRALSTKGRIPKDHTSSREIRCQEVSLLNAGVLGINVIPNGPGNPGEEHALPCRGLDPDSPRRRMRA